MNSLWTQTEAVALCRRIEEVCPPCGCHVALTGGALYKDGERKDLDILFYRIRQVEEIDMEKLWSVLKQVGVIKYSGHGWCYKAITHRGGKKIDIFFPEEQSGPIYNTALQSENNLLEPDL